MTAGREGHRKHRKSRSMRSEKLRIGEIKGYGV